ncbi:endolytic transglycosylase MltG [Sediminibacillus albus]|uniref:YceG-like family protein n=1 Tax=Sediminibacillus albus TaxID=407036 RepID=A0A1G9CSW6_9BACI|nr:endolytic transglycosylase MltG [Sediminibacillus albus]SDK54719.1 YceG-like family protein [Sediminibacillus albus]
MKQPIRAFALGLLAATLLLAFAFYFDGNKNEPAKDMTASDMINHLEQEGYVVKSADEIQAERQSNEQQKQKEEEQTEENSQAEKQQAEDSPESIELEIESGTSTEEIVDVLYQSGIIEDKQSFTSYLIDKNYSTKVQIGQFTIHESMTYQEIANEITGQ